MPEVDGFGPLPEAVGQEGHQEGEDRIEDRATHILNVDFDPIGAGLPEGLRHRGNFRLSPRPARTSR